VVSYGRADLFGIGDLRLLSSPGQWGSSNPLVPTSLGAKGLFIFGNEKKPGINYLAGPDAWGSSKGGRMNKNKNKHQRAASPIAL
jgi:hypothetical protein